MFKLAIVAAVRSSTADLDLTCHRQAVWRNRPPYFVLTRRANRRFALGGMFA
jgi:hypothetical protein